MRPENQDSRSCVSHCSSLRTPLASGKKFDALLDFRQRDYAHMLREPVRGLKPVLDASVGDAGLVVLGQYICVDQE
jgi:hypothetical protein